MVIQVDRFKGYKVVNNPRAAQIVDNSINETWWEQDGWSSMYDMHLLDFKSKLQSWTKDIHGKAERIPFKTKSEKTDELQGVFDFLEKKEGKLNPLNAKKEAAGIFNNPKALYPGKLGFGYITSHKDQEHTNTRGAWRSGNNMGHHLMAWPYPASHMSVECMRIDPNRTFYITNIKDGGVFIWNDALEQEWKKVHHDDPDEFII